MRAFYLAFVLLAGLSSAQSISVTVKGNQGPWQWSQSLNPSFNYGASDNAPPLVVSGSSGLPFPVGGVLTVTYVSGQVNVSPGTGLPPTDANGYLGNTADNKVSPTCGSYPSYFMNPSRYPIYTSELVGTFANNGVIVGTPFPVRNGPSQLTIPSGANQLLLGVNDNCFADNTGSWQLNVTYSPPGSPTILNGGIVNAASYAVANNVGAPVAPGSLAAIFTSPLATQPATFNTPTLPNSLSGVSVTFGGFTAPMVAVVTPSGQNPQVNVQVPFEVLPQGGTTVTVPVVITVNSTPSAPVDATIVRTAPGIFTIPPTGQGNAILVYANPATGAATIAGPVTASLGYPSAPIPRGTTGYFYVTGLGGLTPAVADGSGNCPASTGLCYAATPLVYIGAGSAAMSVPVLFAGQAPGFPGVYQVNITIPQNAPTGDAVSLVVKSLDSTVASNTATIAIQ
ncbi:MAG TPA: hypothetical protein VMT15_05410 [Bryobacteraceae bacterium]|nr:hypothetical protein [Bryobacteraceae bacterium]